MTLAAWAVDELKSDAEVIRQAFGSLIESTGGLVATGSLEITQFGTPRMAVQIAGGGPAEGGLWVPGYTASTGPVYFQNSATYEQVIEAAGASNPRIDTIVARIYDTSLDSSGKHEPALEALRGNEETGVTLSNKKGAAAVPNGCYVRGYILVPAKASSIVTADIENVGGRAFIGAAPITSRTKAQSFLTWGAINSLGGIGPSSGDFTVAHKGTGEYVVTFTKEKVSAEYAVILTTSVEGVLIWSIGAAQTSKSFLVNTTNLSNVNKDAEWSFVVLAGS
jgi:hypothetical protein